MVEQFLQCSHDVLYSLGGIFFQTFFWYRRIAKYYEKNVEDYQDDDNLDDTDFVAKMYSVDIIEPGILKEH